MLWAEIVGWLQKVALLTDLDVFWQQRFSVDIICFVFFFEQGILKQKVFQRILNLSNTLPLLDCFAIVINYSLR